VSQVWQEILQTTIGGPEDDFFEVGGDSLKAMRFMMDLERALGLELSVTLITETPKFAGLFPMTRRMTYPGEVIGIQARGLSGEGPSHATVEAMAAEYLNSIKARQPDGPYCLCGYSFGGTVAFGFVSQETK
jgi:acyl carrier protein